MVVVVVVVVVIVGAAVDYGVELCGDINVWRWFICVCEGQLVWATIVLLGGCVGAG